MATSKCFGPVQEPAAHDGGPIAVIPVHGAHPFIQQDEWPRQ